MAFSTVALRRMIVDVVTLEMQLHIQSNDQCA